MSIKNQSPILCKLYSFYGKVPEEPLAETNVQSQYYWNFFDIQSRHQISPSHTQSQYRKVRVSNSCNQNLFAVKLFQLRDSKTQQRLILQREAKNSKKEITSVVDSLRKFLNILIRRAIFHRFYYRKPNQKLALQSQNTTFCSLL